MGSVARGWIYVDRIETVGLLQADSRIHQQDPGPTHEIQGMFGLELEVGEEVDVGKRKSTRYIIWSRG